MKNSEKITTNSKNSEIYEDQRYLGVQKKTTKVDEEEEFSQLNPPSSLATRKSNDNFLKYLFFSDFFVFFA